MCTPAKLETYALAHDFVVDRSCCLEESAPSKALQGLEVGRTIFVLQRLSSTML